MADDDRRYLVFAERLAREAGEILLSAYGRVGFREKAPGDLVTEADHASQAHIAAAIRREFPEHTLLAEEEGGEPDRDRPWRWIADPLDGTMNFAHGLPLWCVSIALEHAGELVAGVIHVPPLGTTYAAARGLGATVDGRPARVSEARSLRESLIAAALPVDFREHADRELAIFGRFSTDTHSARRTGTTAWNLALVASGACEVAYGTSVHPWDIAAGVLLVREAGGLVTDLRGGPHDLYSPGFLASNGLVHDEAARALSEVSGRA